MLLYKSRTFGELFSDTFTFLKKNGKHFYKNYFIINGVLILSLMVILFFFSRLYSSLFFSDLTNGSYADSYTSYLNESMGTIVIFGLLFFILAVLLGIVNYAYTPLYFLLYEKHGDNNFTKNDILNELKAQLGKIFIFLLAGFVIAIPTFIAITIICVILAVTIVGIPLLLFVFAWLAQFYFIAFIAYLQTDKGIFDCFSYSFNLSFKNFWATNGCIALFYIMIQTVQGFITLIPYSFLIGSIFVGAENGSDFETNEQTFTMVTILTITYMVAFFINLIMVTILQMNQSIIYFSLKEETENINTKSVIDEIGSY